MLAILSTPLPRLDPCRSFAIPRGRPLTLLGFDDMRRGAYARRHIQGSSPRPIRYDTNRNIAPVLQPKSRSLVLNMAVARRRMHLQDCSPGRKHRCTLESWLCERAGP